MSAVYLDYNATAPIRPEARAAVLRALEIGGNPSSIHAAGRAARAVIERARAQVARLGAASPESVIFTSGGTEANALAIASAAASGRIDRLIVGATEHDSVTISARAAGLPVEIWPVTRDGVADLDWLRDRLARGGQGRPFVALMLANNETGVIQPVAEAAALVHAAGGWLHADAVQAPGRVAIDMAALGADTLTLSAHKLGGSQGVGALLFAPLICSTAGCLTPQLHGGGQERGLRAGTENVSGIAGFGAAAEAAVRELTPFPTPPASLGLDPRAHGAGDAHVAGQAEGGGCMGPRVRPEEDAEGGRTRAASRLTAAGAVIAGEGAARLPGVLCTAVEGWDSALQVMALDLAGVQVSAGSACSSGKVKPSGVLAAMGYRVSAAGALRASGGWATTAADWDRFADVWQDAHSRWAARRAPVGGVKEFA